MTILDLRKYRIIQAVLSTTQEEAIADVEASMGLPAFDVTSAIDLPRAGKDKGESGIVFNQNLPPLSERTEKVWEAVKPMRKHVTIEEMIEEQNYKPISREEFYEKIADLNIEEPLEDLLAMLD